MKTTFFRKLRALCKTLQKGKWTLTSGALRCRTTKHPYCPLTFAAKTLGKDFTNGRFSEAGSSLGFEEYESQVIANAADGIGPVKLTRILKKAAGVFERTEK